MDLSTAAFSLIAKNRGFRLRTPGGKCYQVRNKNRVARRMQDTLRIRNATDLYEAEK